MSKKNTSASILGMLRNIVITIVVLATTGTVWAIDGPAVPQRITTIAFLPPENRTGNADLIWLAMAVQDAATVRAGLIPGVAPPTLLEIAVARRKRPDLFNLVTAESILAFGRRLGVEYLLAGELLGDEDEAFTLQSRLLRLKDGEEIWSGTVTGATPVDLMETTSNLVIEICQELGLELPDTVEKRIRSPLTQSTQAAKFHATGVMSLARYLLYDAPHSGYALNSAVELFEHAIEDDPTFAEAWSNLGWALLEADITGTRARAITAFSKARRLKPHLPQANAGYGYAIGAATSKGRRALSSAISLNPALARYHRLLIRGFLEADRETEARAVLDAWFSVLHQLGRADEIPKWEADFMVWKGLAARENGQFSEAAFVLGQALNLYTYAFPTALVHVGLLAADAHMLAAEVDAEREMLRETLALALDIFGERSREHLAAQAQIAREEARRGNNPEAQSAFKRADRTGANVTMISCDLSKLSKRLPQSFPPIHKRILDFGRSLEYYNLPDIVYRTRFGVYL